MITKDILKSPILVEFDPQAQEFWFDYSRDKVVPHIDTLYYTISISGDTNENVLVGYLLDKLRYLKDEKLKDRSADVEYKGLLFECCRFSHYEFCLRLNENYDIFVSSILPNLSTPRIVVQLRTRTLVLNGVMQSVKASFDKVDSILKEFGLFPGEVRENRIDYAYHTNLIQNPYDYFSDNYIIQSLKSRLRLYHKVGNIRGDKIEIDYFSLGNRKSNNVFVRVYNKSQEVIEKNYKSFFIARWRDKKLINRYDEFVYERAYEYKSYYTGIQLGRIEWYLQNGSNQDIKNELSKVRLSCYENSDNVEQLQKVVDRYLPPVTLIMNIEFQTKRKFYLDLEEFIKMHTGVLSIDDLTNTWIMTEGKQFPLHRLYVVHDLKSEICHYLTTQTLSFVQNKGKKNEKYSYWWKRIVDCRIEEYKRKVADVWRERDIHLDKKRAEKRLLGAVAHYNLLNQKVFDENSSFVEDLSDALCALNDNDFYGFASDPYTGEIFDISTSKKNAYSTLKKRKSRQIKPIVKKFK